MGLRNRKQCKALQKGRAHHLPLPFLACFATRARACLRAYQAHPCSCFANCLSAVQASAEQVRWPISGISWLAPAGVLRACRAFVQQVPKLVTWLPKLVDQGILQAVCLCSLQWLAGDVFWPCSCFGKHQVGGVLYTLANY